MAIFFLNTTKHIVLAGCRLLAMAVALFYTIILGSGHAWAQQNAVARYEIDAKRQGVNPTDKDALPRSREFIRLDSTYYVGYMYEGMYKFDRSSDYLGYKNAISPLHKAFVLFEQDYRQNLLGLFQSPGQYMQYMNRYVDYLQLANTLKECYDNVEMPDSVMWVLNKVDAYKFPKDHLGVHTTKAWTYHRNRFYNKQKYSFLYNSVSENEAAAFRLCYHALHQIEENSPKNDLWFGLGQAEADKLSVYHYLALLHSYNKNYDSSEYYYQVMADAGSVSWNNYATLKHEQGEFAVAKEYFERDKYKYTQKMLKEPFYYIPALEVYGGRTKNAIALCKEAIANSGSTPGFGWYNIALARSYMYDGQVDSAELALDKAEDFKEIHIGTTLTQSQYEFTINLLKLQLLDKKMALTKFLNSGWWYSLSTLYRLATMGIEKILLEYVLINQLSANPERERTVYDLFSSESTVTFDDIFYIIKDVSPAFFIKKYSTEKNSDERQNIQRYFKLTTNQLQQQLGNNDEAYTGFKNLLNEVKLDTANEKLFLARLYEGLSKTGDKEGTASTQKFYINALLERYPQLIPFSGIDMSIALNIRGLRDDKVDEVLKQIKASNINWVKSDEAMASATLAFEKRNQDYQVTYTLISANNLVVSNNKMIFRQADRAGRELVQRLFGKGGNLVFDSNP